MSRAISGALVITALALAGALAAAVVRVSGLEARELDAAGAPIDAATVRLLEARLDDGDHVELELCSADAMDPARWAGAGAIAMLRLDAAAETMFEVPIDARFVEGARRGRGESCVTWGRVAGITLDAPEVPIAVDLRWTAGFTVPVRARVLARRPLDGRDLSLVLAALAGALAMVVVLAIRAPTGAHDDAGAGAGEVGALGRLARSGPTRAVLGVVGVLAAGIVIGLVGSGSTIGLLGGLALAGAEVGAAFLLVRPRTVEGAQGATRGSALGLERSWSAPRWIARALAPEKTEASIDATARRFAGPFAIAWLALAPVGGLALFAVARIALATVPSTGEAPVEAFVSWPSGMLSFATLAVVAPVAEEVFFRGLVFGALQGPGGTARTAVAIGGAWLLFAIFHLPQDWGNWGGLSSVLVAGLGFTLMRAGTRSTLVPCVAHLVYNGLLASSALLAGASA